MTVIANEMRTGTTGIGSLILRITTRVGMPAPGPWEMSPCRTRMAISSTTLHPVLM